MNPEAVRILAAIVASVDDELGPCPLTPEDLTHDPGLSLGRVRTLVSRLADGGYLEPMAWRLVGRREDVPSTVGLVEGAGGLLEPPDPGGMEARIVAALWDGPMSTPELAQAVGVSPEAGCLTRALRWLSGQGSVLYPYNARWPTQAGREILPTGAP